jgi:hypothetical protein
LVLTNCNWSASLEEKDPLHFETLMSGTSEQWLPKMSPEVITPLHPTFRILLIPGNVVSMVAEKFRSSSSAQVMFTCGIINLRGRSSS